jgi:hypothetical protein
MTRRGYRVSAGSNRLTGIRNAVANTGIAPPVVPTASPGPRAARGNRAPWPGSDNQMP